MDRTARSEVEAGEETAGEASNHSDNQCYRAVEPVLRVLSTPQGVLIVCTVQRHGFPCCLHSAQAASELAAVLFNSISLPSPPSTPPPPIRPPPNPHLPPPPPISPLFPAPSRFCHHHQNYYWPNPSKEVIRLLQCSHRGRQSHRSELMCCVKVEVAVLGSPSLISLMVSVDVKQRLKKKVTGTTVHIGDY